MDRSSTASLFVPQTSVQRNTIVETGNVANVKASRKMILLKSLHGEPGLGRRAYGQSRFVKGSVTEKAKNQGMEESMASRLCKAVPFPQGCPASPPVASCRSESTRRY